MAQSSSQVSAGSGGDRAFSLSSWLAQFDLGHLQENFERQRVDLATVPLLSDADLQALGVETIGDRRRIMLSAGSLTAYLLVEALHGDYDLSTLFSSADALPKPIAAQILAPQSEFALPTLFHGSHGYFLSSTPQASSGNGRKRPVGESLDSIKKKIKTFSRKYAPSSRFTKEQTDGLLEAFQANQRPSKTEIGELADRLELQYQQVKVWFQNHRARSAQKQKAAAGVAGEEESLSKVAAQVATRISNRKKEDSEKES